MPHAGQLVGSTGVFGFVGELVSSGLACASGWGCGKVWLFFLLQDVVVFTATPTRIAPNNVFEIFMILYLNDLKMNYKSIVISG